MVSANRRVWTGFAGRLRAEIVVNAAAGQAHRESLYRAPLVAVLGFTARIRGNASISRQQ